MATAPVKQQPLHNFPLSLRWGQPSSSLSAVSSSSSHRHRTAAARSPSFLPSADSETDSDPDHASRSGPRVGPRSARSHRSNFVSCFAKSWSEMPAKEVAEKLPKQLTVEAEEEEKPKNEEEEEEGEGENSRPWKLRPRRCILGLRNSTDIDKGGKTRQRQPKSVKLRRSAESSGGGGGPGKRKFWVALEREEIEEDVFIMTGSRPARRPRKRPKNVQKVLDSVFPGLWLVGFTADSYRIAEASLKK